MRPVRCLFCPRATVGATNVAPRRRRPHGSDRRPPVRRPAARAAFRRSPHHAQRHCTMENDRPLLPTGQTTATLLPPSSPPPPSLPPPPSPSPRPSPPRPPSPPVAPRSNHFTFTISSNIGHQAPPLIATPSRPTPSPIDGALTAAVVAAAPAPAFPPPPPPLSPPPPSATLAPAAARSASGTTHAARRKGTLGNRACRMILHTTTHTPHTHTTYQST